MSSFILKIKGLEKTVKSLNEIATRKLPLATEAGLERSSNFVLRVLNQNTPVDTGLLRSSNRKRVFSKFALIGPDSNIAPYAQWVEHGHHTRGGSFIPGQHYIQNTAIEVQRGVNEIFDNAVKIAIR